jgi:hypothetical protein
MDRATFWCGKTFAKYMILWMQHMAAQRDAEDLDPEDSALYDQLVQDLAKSQYWLEMPLPASGGNSLADTAKTLEEIWAFVLNR